MLSPGYFLTERNTIKYRRPTGTFQQGNVNPMHRHETVIHFDNTEEWKIVHGLTNKRQPLCLNGNFHITLTTDKKKVSCPSCLEKMHSFQKE